MFDKEEHKEAGMIPLSGPCGTCRDLAQNRKDQAEFLKHATQNCAATLRDMRKNKDLKAQGANLKDLDAF
ncbi:MULTISPECIES: hypothetical protein [Rhizobium]|uniref:hypothetical protein n=1 Tax=Rhizobium TaxID=379 RepID=UPI00117A3439|nr:MULTISPECIES: hypothetical protein [Rhizobium]MBB4215725.1 hypothetical protein [Rhizobium sp. BK212]